VLSFLLEAKPKEALLCIKAAGQGGFLFSNCLTGALCLINLTRYGL